MIAGLTRLPTVLARFAPAGLALLIALAVFQLPPSGPIAEAAEFCAPGESPEFRFGFAFLKSQLGDVMGDPLDCEHYDADGNAYQKTTTGDLFYNKSINTPIFTRGSQHWAWTGTGLVQWTGASLTPPGVAAPPAGGTTAPAGMPAVTVHSPQHLAVPAAANTVAQDMVNRGRQIFRFDTFGSEAFWGDTLQLHRAIEGEQFGGVGPGVPPKTALAVGLKVDVDALPGSIVAGLRSGTVDLDDPATTLALLKLNAVVGVKGNFNADGSLRSVGITCALCHSTVNDSLTAGVGRRLDGWANRDLNVGAIADLSPNLQPVADLLGVDVATVHAVFQSWGPGRYDAELLLDGKAFRPDGKTAATLLPPAFGLAGVNQHTWTGSWGTVSYWNAFVANTQMHGQGTFYDPRLNNPEKYPIAARAGFADVRGSPDLITAKLADLHFYQLALPAPAPPAGSFDAAAAARGQALFAGKAGCARCHVPPLFTEPGWNLHTAGEIGIDDFQAMRSPDGRYRTAPLKGLWTHGQGGYYHDGRFATLADVVNHYNGFFGLGLTPQEINDLVEYMKSL